MSRRFRIGLVGCGAHAQIAYLPLFKKNQQSEIVAICDSDETKLDSLGQKYGIAHRYQDFQLMLANDAIDAVVIATPNYLHAPMAIAALESGKHVLCENPMAVDLKEAREVERAVRRAPGKFSIAMNGRLRPDVQTLRKFIAEGDLGDVYYVKAGWLIGATEWVLNPWRMDQLTTSGGAFLALGSTLLAITTYLLDSKQPETIYASIHKKDAAAAVEDTAMCVINFRDGALLTIEVSWSLIFEKDFLYCNVFGKKGAALLNPLRIQKELHNELVNVTPSFGAKNPYKVAHELQVQLFLEALRKDVQPPFGIEDGMHIARITDAFYESARTKKLVRI